MTNEEFLRHIEFHLDKTFYEHAKKLIAVAEAAKKFYGDMPVVTDNEIMKALENLERK